VLARFRPLAFLALVDVGVVSGGDNGALACALPLLLLVVVSVEIILPGSSSTLHDSLVDESDRGGVICP